MSQSKEDKKHAAAPSTYVRIMSRLEWPGMLGWLGSIFGVAAIWFLASSLVLGSLARSLEEESSGATAIAESSRWFGFGDRFMSVVMRSKRVEGGSRGSVLVMPDPLTGMALNRVRVAVKANARASGVFGLYAIFITAFLWGFRLFEPSIRAEYAPPPAPTQGTAK
jgi:hypothetical protein